MKTKLFLILLFVSSYTFAQTWNQVGTAQFTADAANVALALNSTGEPYVVYTDTGVDGMVHVEKFDGANWVEIGSNASPAIVPIRLSIAINPLTGYPWITYQDTGTNKQVVKEFDGTNWVLVAADVFGYTMLSKVQLKFAANGDVTIAGTRANSATYRDILDVLRKNNGQTNWTGFSTRVTARNFDLVTANKVAYNDSPNSYERRKIKEYSSSTWTEIYSSNTQTAYNVGVMASDNNRIIYNDYISGSTERLTGENGISSPPNKDNTKQRVHQLIYNPQDINNYAFYIQSNDDLRVVRNNSADGTWTDLSPGLSMQANCSAKMELNSNGDKLFIAYMDTNKVSVKSYAITLPLAVVHVDLNATGNGDGSTWNDAFTDLQSGIDAATLGFSKIWVSAGIYTPGTARTDSFLIDQVTEIYGGFNGTETQLSQRDPVVNVTVLSGDLNADDNATLLDTEPTRQDNAYHVVTLKGHFGYGGILDGFTISGGNANGAVSASCSTPQTQQYKNERGAAIYANPDSGNRQVNMLIENCTLENNTSERVAVFQTFSPCGAQGTSSKVDFMNCIIQNNYSVASSTLAYNASGTYNNKRKGNITNCLIVNNESVNGASAIYLSASGGNGSACVVSVRNTTITKNTSGISKTIKMNNVSYSKLQNSIIYDNGGFQPIDLTGNGTGVNNTIIQGAQLGGSPSNPLFTDVANDDFTLQSGSPATDAGNNSYVTSTNTSDLLNNRRIHNGTVDMGCYEYGSVPLIDLPRIYVDVNATGNNSGSSWVNATPSLASAFGYVDGTTTEIWVAKGTYTPHPTDKTSAFIITKSNLSVYGGFDGTEATISDRDILNNPTILSGDLNDDDTGVDFTGNNRVENSYHVVRIAANGSLLDGFKIEDGNATAAGNNAYAGAIIIDAGVSSVTLKNCEFNKNVGNIGGAIRVYYNTNASFTMENCSFDNNLSRYGSGLYLLVNQNRTVTANITNCLFTNNVSKDLNGTDKGYTGSAMWIRANAVSSILTTKITNCTFANNSDLGTIASQRGPLALSRNNSQSTHNVVISNCISYGNTASSSFTPVNKGHVNYPNTVVIRNSISENNFAPYTDKINTSNANPLFTSGTDFTLQSGSPAIDTGDNSKVPAGIVADLLQHVRIHNTTVDMGCYEFGASSLAVEDFENESSFVLYPNPVRNVLNIRMNAVFEKAVIYNLLGAKVLESKNENIDISHLKSGMYLMKIATEKGSFISKRFIKQ